MTCSELRGNLPPSWTQNPRTRTWSWNYDKPTFVVTLEVLNHLKHSITTDTPSNSEPGTANPLNSTTPLLTGTAKLKPAPPTDFDGSQTNGHTFLNSCQLYINLAVHQFPNNKLKIYWALSYMKSGHIAVFANHTIWSHVTIGSCPYLSWEAFQVTCIELFCPKNKEQTAQIKLEGSGYYQGSRSIKVYLDEFLELVNQIIGRALT